MQRALNPDKILETVNILKNRIEERFPTSSLFKLAGEVTTVAKEAMIRTRKIRRTNWFLRIGIYFLLVLGAAVVVLVASCVRINNDLTELSTMVSVVEATLGTLVFLGAGAYYLGTLETKLKRGRALTAIHELRAFAHIIDMHQLTKDPDTMAGSKHIMTKSSPKRILTTFELGRYLDYCDELLSMISKIAALYVQHFQDPEALAAVDQVETLTNGLSRKIWQKINIVQRMEQKD